MNYHILLYTDDPGVGGVAQYNHAIALGLRQHNHQVTIVQARTANPLIEQQQAAGIRHEWLAFDTLRDFGRTFSDASDAQAIYAKVQPDFILFSDGSAVSNFAAKQAALQAGIPYSIVIGMVAKSLDYHFAPGFDTDFFLQLLAQQYEYARTVIAVSQENLDSLHRIYRLPPDRGQVIHYGRPDRFFAPRNTETRKRLRQEVGISEDAVLCLTAARLESIKGYQYQLEAIAHLKETSIWSNLQFVWIGDGILRAELTQAIAELQVGDRVHLLGQRWDVAEWLDAADIFVLPSELEGMPLAIMEAMAKGVPVIASAVSGIPEELGDTGALLTDPNEDPFATVAELTNSIAAWTVDQTRREAIAQAEKDRANQLFRQDRMVRATVNHIEAALTGVVHPNSHSNSPIQPAMTFLQNNWMQLLHDVEQLPLPEGNDAIATLADLEAWKQQGDRAPTLYEYAVDNALPIQIDAVENAEFQLLMAQVRPFTLLNEERLFSLYVLTKHVCLNDIPGNVVECGAYKGGAAALMAAVIARYSQRPRKLYAFDTFTGMPEPSEADRTHGIPANDTGLGEGQLVAPIAENLAVVCEALNVTDRVIPVAGLFADTLPSKKAEIGEIALLHADGDWYSSTMDIFTTLYENVVTQGVVQIDDYGFWEGCRRAIQDFQQQQGLSFNLRVVDYTAVWFRKTIALNSDKDYAQQLWQLAQTAEQQGDRPLAERATRAILKLVPKLVYAEEFLLQLQGIQLGEGIGVVEKLNEDDPIVQYVYRSTAEFRQQQAQAVAPPLHNLFNLRSLNFVIAPDWQQPEERLYGELQQVLATLFSHPKLADITLLIDVRNTPVDLDPELVVADVTMNLLMEQEAVLAEPEITFISHLNADQKELLLPHLAGMIALEQEDGEAIALYAKLPRLRLDRLQEVEVAPISAPAPNPKQHILLYTDDPLYGGVAQYNHNILLGLAKRGYQVTCVQSRASTPLIEEQKRYGVQHIFLEFDTIKEFDRTYNNPYDGEAIFAATRPDLILFSDGSPVSNFGAKQAAIQLNIPFMSVEGFVAPYLGKMFKAIDLLEGQWRYARAVVAVSQENLDSLRCHFALPGDKGQVIYYGRPEQYFAPRNQAVRDRLRQEQNIPDDAIVCLTVARLEVIKGYQYQLDAIVELKKTSIWEKLYFVWAGGGAVRSQLEAALEEIGVGDHVKVLGQRWDIADWHDAADIFVLPSELEGMPLAIMEAMAKGVPVLATAVSGVPEELGDTGKLLTDPKVDPQATIDELVATIQEWASDAELRHQIGLAGKRRAEALFKEQMMVDKTIDVVERSLLPKGDYVSPGLSIVIPDRAFPNLAVGDTSTCGWAYLRTEIPHNWYVDRRDPYVGFLSRDEAHILYNSALQFKGKKALEIGCWRGWSACHLALAGVELDVIDPELSNPEVHASVSSSLQRAGVLQNVNLIPGFSPDAVETLVAQTDRKWSLMFIDGNHDAPAPLLDAIACEPFAEPDAMILFHDLASPEVSEGLEYLKRQGWNTMIYQTMQIMGVAWRGNVKPIAHQPDPRVDWSLPPHLQQYSVSGVPSIAAPAVNPFSHPLVSVVVTCHHQAQWLPDAIVSVINQTYPNWEVVIVNDGSSDDTSSVARRLIAAYPQHSIKLVEQTPDGLASAKNAGVKHASGEYILLLEADNKLTKNALQHLVDLSLKYASPCVAFGSYQFFGANHSTMYTVDHYSSRQIKYGNLVHTSSLFPKQVWQMLNGYRTDLPEGFEDWEFWLHCLDRFIPLIGTREVLIQARYAVGDRIDLTSQNPDRLLAQLTCYHPEFFGEEAVLLAQRVLNLFEQFAPLGIDSLAQIEQLLKEAQQTGDPVLGDRLQQIRQALAAQWLEIPPKLLEKAYEGTLGRLHQLLISGGIQYQVGRDDRLPALLESAQGWDDPQTIPTLLAAMLYGWAHQFDRSVSLQGCPTWFVAPWMLFLMTPPAIFQEVGEADRYYLWMKQWIDDLHEQILSHPNSLFWQEVASQLTQKAHFIPLYFSQENLKEIYQKRAEIAEFHLRTIGSAIEYEFPERLQGRRKIRLGILARDFLPKAETFASLPVYEYLSREFEVVLYSLYETNDPIEGYCKSCCSIFRQLPIHLEHQLQIIRADDLDIVLIATNVTAVTNDMFLLSLHRLARIQTVSVGSVVTTGIPAIDYYISGQLTDPNPDAQTHYSERLVKLPGTAQCFSYFEPDVNASRKIQRSDLGISEEAIVFTSAVNLYKILPELRETWTQIIAAVPNSVLLLFPFGLNWSTTYPKASFLQRWRDCFEHFGVSTDRLIVADPQPTPDREGLKEYLKVGDIYLDSYPFAGTSSLVEPLQVHLPTIVRQGTYFRSAMGAAILKSIGMIDLVTDSEAAYRELAIALAQDPVLRQQKRVQIGQAMQNSPDFLDSPNYAQKMATLFKALFLNYQTAAISKDYRLRKTNLIAFPDWSQPEDILLENLVHLLRLAATHPDRQQMTFLVHIDDWHENAANEAISSVLLYLMTEEAIDVESSAEVVLVNEQSLAQSLLSQIHFRLVLESENLDLISRTGAHQLPTQNLLSLL